MPARITRVAPIGEYLALHVATKTTSAQPIGQLVNTTASTTVAPGVATVTPASMVGVTSGTVLNVYGGVGTSEQIAVTSTTATTFTATFAQSHSGTYNITGVRGCFLGPVIFNALGTGMTLTLYNGNPDATLSAAFANAVGYGVIAVITPASAPFPFAAVCDYGLWYSYTGTTQGDVTIHYDPTI